MIFQSSSPNSVYRRRFITLATGLGLGSLVHVVRADESGLFELVTGEEYARALSQGAEGDSDLDIVAKSLYPSIVIEEPALDAESLTSPLNIVVRFYTTESETIDMKSLRITYGGFIDVTDRLLAHAEIGDGFIRADKAELPRGKHKFLISIKDSAGRKAEQYIKVTIV